MDHRTYGETTDCKGCRYWSEMIARSDDALVLAMCLSPVSLSRAKYTAGYSRCEQWASGYDGAIDEPGSDSERYSNYEQEEAA